SPVGGPGTPSGRPQLSPLGGESAHRRWNLRRQSSRLALGTSATGLTSSILQSGYDSGLLRIVSARGSPAPAQQAEFSSLPIAFNIIRPPVPSWFGFTT